MPSLIVYVVDTGENTSRVEFTNPGSPFDYKKGFLAAVNKHYEKFEPSRAEENQGDERWAEIDFRDDVLSAYDGNEFFFASEDPELLKQRFWEFYFGDFPKCDSCKGTGKVVTYGDSMGLDDQSIKVDCDECGGRGK